MLKVSDDQRLAWIQHWLGAGLQAMEALLAQHPSSGSFCHDAQTLEYVDMLKAGIIDPTKVVRMALQNAASIAGLLVTTEAIVAEKPEKKTPSAMPHGGGMGGMGGMDDF